MINFKKSAQLALNEQNQAIINKITPEFMG